MKKRKVLVLVIIFSFLAIPFSYTWGQEKITKKQEKEFQAQEQKLQEIKKAMAEEKKAQYKRAEELYRIGEYERVRAYPSYPSPPAPLVALTIGGSENSFNLSLMKSFKGESATKSTTFTVDDDQNKIRFSVGGRCEEGSITVSFILPSGKSFTKIEIDSSADIEWTQSLSVEEESIYKGQWKVEIKAVKAKGMYKLNIKSF